MRILFLCGSLQAGKDGVGDYTRRLAAELIKQGHEVAILSLRDKFIIDEFKGVQSEEGIEIPVYRNPYTTAYRSCRLVQKWIDAFEPDWLSLQYVPFSFHKKGLPFGLSKFLKRIGNKRKWHIMFHELWLGMDIQATVKHVSWGWIQRQLITSLARSLEPSVVHTQTHIYKENLERLNIEAQLLPLFGNIRPYYKNALTNMYCASSKKHDISFVLFGGIHPGAPVNEFAKEVALYSKTLHRSVKLIVVGRCGSELVNWANAWKSESLSIEILGEQSADFISQILTKASFGITTTPILLVEKSGTVAAMKEHGLPVICVAREWHTLYQINIQFTDGVFEYKRGNLKSILNNKWISRDVSTVTSVSLQLTQALL